MSTKQRLRYGGMMTGPDMWIVRVGTHSVHMVGDERAARKRLAGMIRAERRRTREDARIMAAFNARYGR